MYNISIPREHLQAIVSSATDEVLIRNQYLWIHRDGVTKWDDPSLKIILDSVKSKVLAIRETDLNPENTQALVRAMDTRVEEVRLGWHEKTCLHFPEVEELPHVHTSYELGIIWVSFDIEALIKFKGDGVCKSLVLGGNCPFANIYEETIRMWADSRIYWDFKMNYGDDEVRLSLERTFQMSFKT